MNLAALPLTRAAYLRRTFSAAFEALKELQKTEPAEAAEIFDALAAHVRSASPQSFLTEAAPLVVATDVTAIERELGAGARYEIRIVDGTRMLLVHDEHEHDALVSLTDAQRLTLCEDLRRVR